MGDAADDVYNAAYREWDKSMTDKIEYFNITCEYRYQTAKAVLVLIDNGEQWIPKTCLSDADANSIEAGEYDSGEEIEIKVARWFAEKEGLI